MPSDRVPKHKEPLATGKGAKGSKIANSPAPRSPGKEDSGAQQEKKNSPPGTVKRKIVSGGKQERNANPEGMEE